MNDFNFEEPNIRVGFVGGGALTESIVNGIRGNLTTSHEIFISDHKKERCNELINRYRVNASVGIDSFIEKVELLIIAVKPKDIAPTLTIETDEEIAALNGHIWEMNSIKYE